MAGSAAYNLNNRQLRSDLRGDNIDLEKITELQTAPLQERGTASFTAQDIRHARCSRWWTRMLKLPTLSSTTSTRVALVLDAVSHGSKLQVTARSKFPHGSLALDGTVDLKGDMQSDLRLQFTQIDIDPLLRGETQGHDHRPLRAGGTRQPHWPIAQAARAQGRDAWSTLSPWRWRRFPFTAMAPSSWRWPTQWSRVQRLTVAAEDSNLSIGGSVDLKGDRPLDLYAKGHLNVALLHVLDNEITSYGTTDADITVQGTMAKPVMNGPGGDCARRIFGDRSAGGPGRSERNAWCSTRTGWRSST